VLAAVTSEELSSEYQALLLAVAEELKLPLTRIARQAELLELSDQTAITTLAGVRQNASSALELIDGYLLGFKLAVGQQSLQLEPVSTTSVIYDVAEQLEAVAQDYEVELSVQTGGHLAPVMANAAGLKTALVSLGTAMIEAQIPSRKPSIVTLAVRRGPKGIVTGWYSSSAPISQAELKAATGQLPGTMRQPLKHFSSSGAAGIFVAQNIFKAMSAGLSAGRYHKQTGLAAVLQPSRQLQLV